MPTSHSTPGDANMVCRSPAIAWTAAAAILLMYRPVAQAIDTERPAIVLPQATDALLQAEARYAQADFEGALHALEQAEQTSLSRADVVRLYSLRALIHHALGEEASMRDNLRVLAALAPTHEWGPSAPPAVRQVWDEVRQSVQVPLSLHVHVEHQPQGVHVSATSRGEVGDIVREIRVSARVNEGPWVQSDGLGMTLPTSDGDLVEYYATVLGPGGSVLLERGTAQAPLRWRLSNPNRTSPWLWGLVGVAVGAVGMAVVWWLVESGGERSTALAEPQLRW